MSDKQSAGLLLAIAGVAFILWYRRRSEGERAALFGSVAHADALPEASSDNPGIPEGERGARAGNPTGTPLERLLAFASAHDLRVTATTGGEHNPGSLHFLGRAIDVSSRGMTDAAVARIREFAQAAGLHVLDERTRLPGERVWGGPHLHISLPLFKDGRWHY